MWSHHRDGKDDRGPLRKEVWSRSFLSNILSSPIPIGALRVSQETDVVNPNQNRLSLLGFTTTQCSNKESTFSDLHPSSPDHTSEVLGGLGSERRRKDKTVGVMGRKGRTGFSRRV